MSGFQSKKIFLPKDILLTRVKRVPWTCLISDLNGEEIVGSFYKKKLQKKKKKKNLEMKKY